MKYLLKEVWKDIEDFEGLYQVSNFGNAKRIAHYDTIGRYLTSRYLKPSCWKDGHYKVDICGKKYFLHILVYETFFGQYNHKTHCVHHENHNPQDNHLTNLVLMSKKEHISLHHKGKPKTNEQKLKISQTKLNKRSEEERIISKLKRQKYLEKYNQENKEKILKRSKEYYYKNRDKIIQRQIEYKRKKRGK